jgi:hypothetical protein
MVDYYKKYLKYKAKYLELQAQLEGGAGACSSRDCGCKKYRPKPNAKGCKCGHPISKHA